MRGYKRGDEYQFETKFGITRHGIIVRSDKDSITVRYNAEERSRTRVIKREEVYASKRRKI